MMRSFKTKGMGAGSFFKILYIGNFMWSILFVIVAGAIVFFAPQTTPTTGVEGYLPPMLKGVIGYIIALLLTPLYALLQTIVQWIFIGFGLWLWTRFKTVEISLSVVESTPSTEI